MDGLLRKLHSRRVGLALSGGGVRGLAHIGVIKALDELGIRPAVIAGTSAGSIIGAGLAAGMGWHDLTLMAHSTFWPALLHGGRLERFCATHLPATFAQLKFPFAAMATILPTRRAVAITEGQLASAISASCALRVVRRPVVREGERFKDGGLACVLPSVVCREMGAELVIGSDVWELGSLLRGLGFHPTHPRGRQVYPGHYRRAVEQTDLLIQPSIPAIGYVPGAAAVERMIAAGEAAARRMLSFLSEAEAR
ncbi:MAG TPA: patatin-like phospholipase family protein [Blastocatellia bacterium]|nr:patatin-like phospholipase family protein [Blastocatellia bacterium]